MSAVPVWEDSGDVNTSVPDATGCANWSFDGAASCSWCEAPMRAADGLYCSPACRASDKSDRNDTNPEPLRDEFTCACGEPLHGRDALRQCLSCRIQASER